MARSRGTLRRRGATLAACTSIILASSVLPGIPLVGAPSAGALFVVTPNTTVDAGSGSATSLREARPAAAVRACSITAAPDC
jgi:hypothetical protein